MSQKDTSNKPSKDNKLSDTDISPKTFLKTEEYKNALREWQKNVLDEASDKGGHKKRGGGDKEDIEEKEGWD